MAQLMMKPISRQPTKQARTAPAGGAAFKRILSEDIDWKPFAAFPPAARLNVVVGRPSEPGPYTIRVKVPHGVKLMPHRRLRTFLVFIPARIRQRRDVEKSVWARSIVLRDIVGVERAPTIPNSLQKGLIWRGGRAGVFRFRRGRKDQRECTQGSNEGTFSIVNS